MSIKSYNIKDVNDFWFFLLTKIIDLFKILKRSISIDNNYKFGSNLVNMLKKTNLRKIRNQFNIRLNELDWFKGNKY